MWFYLLFCLYNSTFVFMKNMRANKKHCIMRFLARTPLGVLYVVSDFIFPFLYYVLRYRRRIVRENLRSSFPEMDLREIVRIEKKFYHGLIDTFIEAFKCLNIGDDEMRKRVEVLNYELVERYASEGKSIFMLLGHCGCWEWVQEVCTRYSSPKRNCELYKNISSPYFSSLMYEIRSRWDTEQIEMNQAVRTLLRWSADGVPFLCGFIQDQRPSGMKVKNGLIFLNQETPFVPGAEEIARKVGAAMVYLDIEKTMRGHYRFTFKEMTLTADLASEHYPLSVLYFKMLEQTILKQPEIWLWSHNRWAKWSIA